MASGMTEIGARLRLRDRPQFVRDADIAGDAIERLERRTHHAGLAARVTAGAYGGLRSAVGSLASFATHGVAAIGVGTAALGVGFVKMGLQANAGYEMATVALTNMLGDAKKAQNLVSQVEEYAIRSPFAFPDVLQSTRALVAMGVEGDKVLGMVKVIGDASAGLGAGSEGVERMSRALGQMMAKGFPSGEEMRQLADTGVRAWEYLARSIGKSIPETMKRAERRMISGHDAVSAILAGIAQDFKGQTEAQLDTLAGRWEEFTDLVRRSARKATEPFVPMIKKTLVKVGKYFEDFANDTLPVWQMMFRTGSQGIPLNDEIDSLYQRIYHLGAAWDALFGDGPARWGDFATSIGLVLDPTGKLNEIVGKGVDMFKDLWTILNEGVLPVFKELSPILLLVLAPLTQLDDILEFLADHTDAVKVATVLLLTVWATKKTIDLYTGAVMGTVQAYQRYKQHAEGVKAANALVKAGFKKVWYEIQFATLRMKEWIIQQGKNLIAGAKELAMNAKIAAAWALQKVKLVALKAAQVAVTVATAAWSAAQWLLNAALNANPIGLIVIAIAALVGAIWYAYTHWDWFRNAVDKAWQGLQILWDWFLKIVDFIWDKTGMDSYFDTAVENAEKIVGWFQDLWDLLVKINGYEVKIPIIGDIGGGGFLGGALSSLGPLGWAASKLIPGGAYGADVTTGGRVRVGENGPEIVTLPTGASVRPPKDETVDADALSSLVAIPARFQVLDGGRHLFDIVRESAQDEGARI